MAAKRKPKGPIRLTKEQERLYKELREQAKKQRKQKNRSQKTIGWIILAVLAVCFVIKLIVEQPAVHPVQGKLMVHFIDVGQGDCIYVSAGDENMLIDCGESSEAENVIDYLESCGVERLDYVIGSHPHSDHMGGMYRICDAFDVGQLIIPHIDDSDIPTTSFFEKLLDSVERNDIELSEAELFSEFALGDARCTIIAPNSEKYGDLNNYSVGLILRHGSNSFIFTGDAEREAEREMLAGGRLSHIDVYKAGHHGSDTSSTEEFLAAITPDYAVISCGKDNSYGHPRKAMLDRVEKYVDEIYRTDLCGTIVFESDGESYDIRTERSMK